MNHIHNVVFGIICLFQFLTHVNYLTEKLHRQLHHRIYFRPTMIPFNMSLHLRYSERIKINISDSTSLMLQKHGDQLVCNADSLFVVIQVLVVRNHAKKYDAHKFEKYSKMVHFVVKI